MLYLLWLNAGADSGPKQLGVDGGTQVTGYSPCDKIE